MFDDIHLNSLGGCSEALEGTTALRERGRTRLQQASFMSWEVISLTCKFESLMSTLLSLCCVRFGF